MVRVTSTSASPSHRTALSLLALATGGFGIGTTEFVAMGLLPNIAQDLMPALYATSPSTAEARAGIIVSTYALGVVIGAPLIAATTARMPRKRLLLILLTAFTVFTAASAFAPTYGTVLVARFLAGLPHGAYFGIASLVAADLMGPGMRARGVSMVLAGLTIANVVGVPAITWIGQVASWRVAYVAVAALFALALVSVWATVPQVAVRRGASIRSELSAFANPRFWLMVAVGAIGTGGFFSFYSYVSPMVTNLTPYPEGIVPLILICIGIGMTCGNLLSGRIADRSVRAGLLTGFIGLVACLLLLAVTAQWIAAVFVVATLLGLFSSMFTPAVQARLLDLSPVSPSIDGAMTHSALNIGNSLGAFLGGAAIAATIDYHSQLLVGAALGAVGMLLALVSFRLDARR